MWGVRDASIFEKVIWCILDTDVVFYIIGDVKFKLAKENASDDPKKPPRQMHTQIDMSHICSYIIYRLRKGWKIWIVATSRLYWQSS